MKDSLHSDERIARVWAPLLVLHGERDTIIPMYSVSGYLRWRASPSAWCASPTAAMSISMSTAP
jgi:alpha-beta hydrolase superfamily lysophospholipase